MSSNNINLNFLPFFIAVAESRTLEEAADKIEYNYSTVSTNISKLEKQYGVKLFTRKPLQLTEVGKDIYETIKNGISDIEFATVIADSKNNIECGRLSIGCPSHIVEFYLMEIIAKATKDYPNLQISLDTSYECGNLIEAVKNNKIDFAIVDRIPSQYEKDIEIKEIKHSEYILVANQKIVINDVKELENYKYILAGEQRTNTIKLSKILKQYDVELDVRLRCRFNRAKNKCSKIWSWNCLCFKRGSKKSIKKW